jgi:hypothetical protein
LPVDVEHLRLEESGAVLSGDGLGLWLGWDQTCRLLQTGAAGNPDRRLEAGRAAELEPNGE